MNRGKKFGITARFHRYNKCDKKNCSRSNGSGLEISYAVLSSMRLRRERDNLIRRQPELSKILKY